MRENFTGTDGLLRGLKINDRLEGYLRHGFMPDLQPVTAQRSDKPENSVPPDWWDAMGV